MLDTVPAPPEGFHQAGAGFRPGCGASGDDGLPAAWREYALSAAANAEEILEHYKIELSPDAWLYDAAQSVDEGPMRSSIFVSPDQHYRLVVVAYGSAASVEIEESTGCKG